MAAHVKNCRLTVFLKQDPPPDKNSRVCFLENAIKANWPTNILYLPSIQSTTRDSSKNARRKVLLYFASTTDQSTFQNHLSKADFVDHSPPLPSSSYASYFLCSLSHGPALSKESARELLEKTSNSINLKISSIKPKIEQYQGNEYYTKKLTFLTPRSPSPQDQLGKLKTLHQQLNITAPFGSRIELSVVKMKKDPLLMNSIKLDSELNPSDYIIPQPSSREEPSTIRSPSQYQLLAKLSTLPLETRLLYHIDQILSLTQTSPALHDFIQHNHQFLPHLSRYLKMTPATHAVPSQRSQDHKEAKEAASLPSPSRLSSSSSSSPSASSLSSASSSSSQSASAIAAASSSPSYSSAAAALSISASSHQSQPSQTSTPSKEQKRPPSLSDEALELLRSLELTQKEAAATATSPSSSSSPSSSTTTSSKPKKKQKPPPFPSSEKTTGPVTRSKGFGFGFG